MKFKFVKTLKIFKMKQKISNDYDGLGITGK